MPTKVSYQVEDCADSVINAFMDPVLCTDGHILSNKELLKMSLLAETFRVSFIGWDAAMETHFMKLSAHCS